MSTRKVMDAFTAKGYTCIGLVTNGPTISVGVRYVGDDGRSHAVAFTGTEEELLAYAAMAPVAPAREVRTVPGNKVLRIDVKKKDGQKGGE
jgi:hypothetical protein